MENLNGHEAGNGGYSQGDTYRCRLSTPLLGGREYAISQISRSLYPAIKLRMGFV
jgi:hypothetical protein